MPAVKGAPLPLRAMFRSVAFASAILMAALSGNAARAAGPGGTAESPKAIGNPCAGAPAFDDSLFAQFIEKLETPGETISMASFPPDLMAKLMATQKAEGDRRSRDWPYLCRYADRNAEVVRSGRRPTVVFMGDSITDFWQYADPAFFGAANQDRGISGQTTPQMLVRFYPDVIALKPRVVVILAGVNDLAGNTGPSTDQMILDNIRAMIDLAKANEIRVVLASLTPAAPKQAGPDPVARLNALNDKLRRLAAEEHVVYLDYNSKMQGPGGLMPKALTNDGLHPNRAGYAVMRPLAERAIAQALRWSQLGRPEGPSETSGGIENDQ